MPGRYKSLFDKDVIERVFELPESGNVDQRRRAGKALDEETRKLRVRFEGRGGRASSLVSKEGAAEFYRRGEEFAKATQPIPRMPIFNVPLKTVTELKSPAGWHNRGGPTGST
jgi:hypothetical protein